MKIDLNCDMGESFGRYRIGNDFEILQYVSSCNIACGFHAGDPGIIIETIQEAHKQGVHIGAHPSYPDLQGFGRRRMHLPGEELIPILQYQIAVIDRLAQINSANMTHVKAHGALYNHAFEDDLVAHDIASAFVPWVDSTLLFVQYGSSLQAVAKLKGINTKVEGFADRRYTADLNLMSRSDPRALHHSIDDMVDQVISMVLHKNVNTEDGKKDIHVDTICIHGDHPKAIEIVKTLVNALHGAGIETR